ncbi:NAD(P)-bd_dom domain-containing protein [Haematococcus lacustris]|uniref:NAD(P)-bd_dom domain-containing protein n=1 Tax=Haematococcus lacustris TaxID=44745 RepID=A0A699ZVB8_HAELA|nr:NAD(P)-bd_dom domain-containing protein [Haematococcus lacustris]
MQTCGQTAEHACKRVVVAIRISSVPRVMLAMCSSARIALNRPHARLAPPRNPGLATHAAYQDAALPSSPLIGTKVLVAGATGGASGRSPGASRGSLQGPGQGPGQSSETCHGDAQQTQPLYLSRPSYLNTMPQMLMLHVPVSKERVSQAMPPLPCCRCHAALQPAHEQWLGGAGAGRRLPVCQPAWRSGGRGLRGVRHRSLRPGGPPGALQRGLPGHSQPGGRSKAAGGQKVCAGDQHRGGRPHQPVEPVLWGARGEEVLQRSGLDYTIIRPGGLKNQLRAGEVAGNVVARGPGFYGVPPRGQAGSILRRQVAEVCVAALSEPAAANKVVEVIATPDAPALTYAQLFASVGVN